MKPARRCFRAAKKGKEPISSRKTIAILGIAALVIGGAVSLAASSNPDGLEWSMERLTGSTELENDGTGAHAAAEEIQEKRHFCRTMD